MRKALVVAFTICFLSCVVWLWKRDARLDRLAEDVRELTRVVRSLVEARIVADVNLTDGDSALDHATTVNWTSGTQTVQLTVYKNSATETQAEYRKQVTDATDKYQTLYPPSLE